MSINIIIFILLKMLNTASDENYPVYPQGYFSHPLNIDLKLSGTFGEIRSSHFHSGIDIKTNQVVGLPVLSSADGYISRIKVSSYGFGKAIYIQHPNGFLTVYAHLQKFNAEIEAFVRKNQYKNKSYSIELYPGPDQFKLKKGEVFAFSGNTGGSGGPHLHFEIRDAKTQKPVNPLLFGFEVKDSKDPVLEKLGIYDPKIPDQDPRILNLVKKNDSYSVPGDVVVTSHPSVGLAVSTFDQADATHNKNGIYRIKLYDNDELVYHFEVEKFAFNETRYVLAHIDYEEKMKHKYKLQRCFILDGNKFSGYKFQRKQGILDLSDMNTHDICIEVDDALGNHSVLKFPMKYDLNEEKAVLNEENHIEIFHHDQYNEYSSDDFKVSIPSGALFEDLPFTYMKTEGIKKHQYSDIHQVHKNESACFKYFNISIKTKNLPLNLQDKALIVNSENGDILDSEGGSFNNGWINTRIRSFGEYFVSIDSVKPKIRTLNLKGGDLFKGNTIKFEISDNLAGIEDFDLYIDGKWVLAEYDPKKKLLFHQIEKTLLPGEHILSLIVIDDRHNKAELKLSFKI